jgi:hypothetical protein
VRLAIAGVVLGTLLAYTLLRRTPTPDCDIWPALNARRLPRRPYT